MSGEPLLSQPLGTAGSDGCKQTDGLVLSAADTGPGWWRLGIEGALAGLLPVPAGKTGQGGSDRNAAGLGQDQV